MPSAPSADPGRLVIEAHAGPRIELIAESFRRVTGADLVSPESEAAEQLWEMPAVVLAHGTEADPLFFYANRTALNLFEMSAEEMIRTPSRHSAQPLARDERARLMAKVAVRNFISDYAGIRISKSGRLFRIEQATVWNLLDAAGVVHGQAAWFTHWTMLDSR